MTDNNKLSQILAKQEAAGQDEQSFDISAGINDEFDLSKLPSLNSVISEDIGFADFKKKI